MSDDVFRLLEKKNHTNLSKRELEGQDIADREQNRELRRQYANKVFYYLCSYSIFSGLILILQGFSFYNFNLHESVAITLVGSTAIAAIALVLAVIKGLFPTNSLFG